jgi:hypothetical protein
VTGNPSSAVKQMFSHFPFLVLVFFAASFGLHVETSKPAYERVDLLAPGLLPPTEQVCLKCRNEKNPFSPEGEVLNCELRREQGAREIPPLKYPH